MSVAEKPAHAAGLQAMKLDVELLRRDFPILQMTVHGQPLVYLDNAATTQKPQQVIDRLRQVIKFILVRWQIQSRADRCICNS